MDEHVTKHPEPDRSPQPRRLQRSQDERMLAGVCSGIGRYFDVDPNLVRVGFLVLCAFGGGGIVAYLAAWVLLPEEEDGRSVAQNLIEDLRRTRAS